MTIDKLKRERDQIDTEIRDLERKVYDLEAKKREVEWDLAVAQGTEKVS